jgi:nitroimidazol reductase NimA-like FMN-containing flavoprotein (pyridoxamine 5'-phosphate oxidase superfamily)
MSMTMAKPDIDEIRNILKGLFSSQKLAVLSTHRDGQPYASLVAFVASDDLRQIYFATPNTTRKYANLMADSRVAFLIDSRLNEESDIHAAMATTAMGSAREIDKTTNDIPISSHSSSLPPAHGFVPILYPTTWFGDFKTLWSFIWTYELVSFH